MDFSLRPSQSNLVFESCVYECFTCELWYSSIYLLWDHFSIPSLFVCLLFIWQFFKCIYSICSLCVKQLVIDNWPSPVWCVILYTFPTFRCLHYQLIACNATKCNCANWFFSSRSFNCLASRFREVLTLRGESVQFNEMDRHGGDEDRLNWRTEGAYRRYPQPNQLFEG